MKLIIQILPNIYGVKVPKDVEYKIETLKEDDEFEESKILILDTLEYFDLPDGNWQILGTLTKDEISFDFEEIFGLDWDAFRSALPEDIYFEDPFEEPKKNDYVFEEHPELVGNPKEYDEETYQLDLQDYQTAQENITHKLLILQKL